MIKLSLNLLATKPEFLVAKEFRALGWLLKYYAWVKPA